eukprot:TRINITY_DN24753_c0_g1_i1.p2 TRINITY_DN24753_c0_g1~~TRINITY_DN24753_c0_g1_i1.p2  ORF type:complete len:129 (+),score=23.92 TRINITY_DN24753_c0_g1_i1:2-388(+)
MVYGSSDVTVTDTLFQNNAGPSIYLHNSVFKANNVTLRNNKDNVGSSNSGTVQLEQASNAYFSASTFQGNVAAGSAVNCRDGSDITFSDCVLDDAGVEFACSACDAIVVAQGTQVPIDGNDDCPVIAV